jgi:hypothetical protein
MNQIADLHLKSPRVAARTDTRTSRNLLTLAAGLAFGGIAVWQLRQEWAKDMLWPWLILLLSMLAAAGALRGLELWLPGEPILPHLAAFPAQRRRIFGAVCIVAALALTSLVAWCLWPDYHQWHGTPPFWLAALTLTLIGAWLVGAVGRGSPRAATALTIWLHTRRNYWLEVAAFALIFALAIFLRIYHFDTIPSGIYVDETNGALDALYILEGRDVSPFGTGWYGTPNGYLYYMAGIFRLLGANWMSLKIVSLIPAILTVPAVYLLGRLMFGPLTGLSAMLLMAVSRWHLSMSRWGWNETAPPLFQVLAMFFLIRGLRDRRALDYALSGLLTGLSVYTYLSARLAAATLLLYILYWLLSDPSGLRASVRRSWLGLAILAAATTVAVGPIAVTYITDPFTFNNRVSEVNVFRDVRDQGSLVPLIQNIGDILKFFHQTGDHQGKHNLPYEPMADPITGLLFAVGLAYAVIAWRDQRRILLLFWSYPELARYLSRSISWVKKWSKRLKTAALKDQTVLKSQSRCPKHPPPAIEPVVIERILAIRDQPPDGLQRTPGPVAIKYYLHKMEKTAPLGCYLPTSTSTVWRILDEHQRIIRPAQSEREPTPQAEPLQVWQMDFKDVCTVIPEPEGKRQHQVETLNVLDTGTSVLVDNPPRTDFNAETVIETLAQTLQQVGCPVRSPLIAIHVSSAVRAVGISRLPLSASWPVCILKPTSVPRNVRKKMALSNVSTTRMNMKEFGCIAQPLLPKWSI